MLIKDYESKYNFLRKKYSFFVYDSYNVNIEKTRIILTYHFNISNNFFFTPTIIIPIKPFFLSNKLSVENIENIAFHIGMIELISYWKATCSQVIIIKPHILNTHQLDWWRKLYFNGLGEFFYTNSIHTSIDSFLTFDNPSDKILKIYSDSLTDGTIIPVGGGKDSIVSLELLSKFNTDNVPFVLNPRQAIMDSIKIAGYETDNIFEMQRTICPELLKLNDNGFLNGHTPFSALLAFTTVLASLLTDKKNIALSNESSANESTVANSEVNHQYSKSYEFENDFKNYVNKYISEEINYFSFLRPLFELQIAKIFSKYPAYFDVFKSCNVGSKINSWCCKCPKCLFVYIIISPFVSQEKMISIFGSNLFEDEEMLFFLKQLCGLEKTKPFECVGTIDEVNIALCTIIINQKKLPYLLKFYKESVNYEQFKNTDITAILRQFDNNNFLTTELKTILINAIND